MNPADRPNLNWKRPPEWDQFLDAVEENHGATVLYAGFAVEQAWQEYREQHPSEVLVDRLLRAVGSRGRDAREKNSDARAVGEGKGRVSVRVRKDVKEDMAAYAAEKDVQKHEVLRSVVLWYLDGGRLGRVTEKLRQAVPEAERQLADLDTSTDETIGPKGRRTVELCRQLTEGGDEFHRDDFRDALDTVQGISDSEYCRGEYLPRVLSQLNYAAHPNNPDVFVPEERAEEIAAEQDVDLDGPAVDRKSYADLTDTERVHGLRVELARDADRRAGAYAYRVEDVRTVFDGHPSKRKARTLMDKAAREDGYATDTKGGDKRLTVDLGDVGDEIRDALSMDTDTDNEPATVDDRLAALTEDATPANQT